MKRVALLVSAVLAASLAAVAAAGATPAPRVVAHSGATHYPLTLHTSSGTLVIAAKPTRILSLSASSTQMLYAIGAGSEVVGVDEYSTYPANAPRTSFTGAESSAEDYMTKHPDFVVLAYDEHHLVSQLSKLHVPAIVLGPAATVSDAESQMNELGEITNHQAGASSADRALTKDLAKIVAPAKKKAKGASYYIEFDPTYYSATSGSFIGALLAGLGMRNIADPAGHGSDYPQLSAEYVAKANPSYVFLADIVCCGQSAITFAKRPGMSKLHAVTEHHVVAVNDSLASEWGPHSMEAFLQTIVNAVG